MEEFDLDRYLRASKRVDLDDVAWHHIADTPLTGAEARCLAYMMDIEWHTAMYLRDVLATRAAFEPDITAFLSCWAYEELWHGEALGRFLGEAGFVLAPNRGQLSADSPYPSNSERNAWIRQSLGRSRYLFYLLKMAGSALVRESVAVHMTWGAVNELSTLTAYHALIAGTRHPVLVDVLTRIIKDERRHFAFYRAQARIRLSRSSRARLVTRWVMDHLWAPVGTGARPQLETDFVVVSLFGGSEGARLTRELDETIGRLPGFEDAALFECARRRALARLSSKDATDLSSDAALAEVGLVRSLPDHERPPGS